MKSFSAAMFLTYFLCVFLITLTACGKKSETNVIIEEIEVPVELPAICPPVVPTTLVPVSVSCFDVHGHLILDGPLNNVDIKKSLHKNKALICTFGV